MNAPLPFVCDGDQLVTASDLVRNFGAWQDRALRAPIYVLHRGRPRLVLTSIELMDTLCAPHATPGAGGGEQLHALLDALREAVLIADRAGAILAVGRAARARFGGDARVGAPVARLVHGDGAPLVDALARVIASGLAETIEVVPERYPTRRLAVTLTPLGDGAALSIDDATAADECLDTRAATEARAAALLAAGDVADVAINPRGYCETPTASLAALTGVAPTALAGARFITLFTVASRVALGDALETVVAERHAVALDAALLVNRGDPRTVRVGLAPRRRGAAVEGIVGVIRATS